VTVLQFIEGLSDRGAADAVRGRIDWKYLLCLELEDPGFDHSVLCEFRTRLLEGGAERILFDKILSALRDKKLVKSRTRQRTDSTQVLAAVRDLNRLERVGETLHATLNVLAVAASEWVRGNIPTEWGDRYGKRVDEWRLPEKEKDREIYIQMVGQDGAALLDAVWSEEAPGWMRSLPAVETLRRMWVQQFMVVEGAVLLRPSEDLPP
jgi:transposase